MTARGPVEGWIVFTHRTVGFVKGCFQPLPLLYYVPRLVDGRKYWRNVPLVSDGAADVVEDFCLGRAVAVVDPARASLLDPVEAKRGLRSCSTRVCRAAWQLLEHLAAAVGEDRVGVTGGLVYNIDEASDVDLVVYGPRFRDAYCVLHELREEGITQPYDGVGHGWTLDDAALGASIASRRVLFGLVNGVEYNVRLVPCEAPQRCYRVRRLGPATLKAVICGGTPYTTPALYLLCGTAVARLLITFRLRYTELPLGAIIEARGSLEEHCGMRVIVPDADGYVRLLSPTPGKG